MIKRVRLTTAGLVLALIAGLGFATMETAAVRPAEAQANLEAARLDQGERPVVVELYTSQGCSSCPPADAFLGELAEVPGVLALSFHVDYWDYIGWKDTFASAEHTERQRHYMRALSLRYVYTPQMVVDGIYDAAGFRRRQVYGALEKALETQRNVPIVIAEDGRQVSVSAGAAPGEGASLYLAMFDRAHQVDIGRGENSGRKLVYHNVVRDYRKLADWNGQDLEVTLDPAWAEGRDGCAVILQEGDSGRIIGAAVIPLPEG